MSGFALPIVGNFANIGLFLLLNFLTSYIDIDIDIDIRRRHGHIGYDHDYA